MDATERRRLVDDEVSKCVSGEDGRIHANCIMCIYDPALPGTMREQVDACTATTCPTYKYRPGTGKNKAKQVPHDGKARYGAVIRQLVDKGTKSSALDAFCVECIYDPYSKGSWRKQVTSCIARNCPLWSRRPKSSKRGSE